MSTMNELVREYDAAREAIRQLRHAGRTVTLADQHRARAADQELERGLERLRAGLTDA